MENSFQLQLVDFSNSNFPDFAQVLYADVKKESIFFSCLVGLLEIICRGKKKNSEYAGNITQLFKTYLNSKTDFSEENLVIQSQGILNQVIELLSNDTTSHTILIEWLWQYILPGPFCQNIFLMFAFKNMIFCRKISTRLYSKLVNSNLLDYNDVNEILENFSEMFGVLFDLIDISGNIREIKKSSKSALPRITIIQCEEFNYCLARYKHLQDYDSNAEVHVDLLKHPFVVLFSEETDLNTSLYTDTAGVKHERAVGSNDNLNFSMLSQAESIRSASNLEVREASYKYSFSYSSDPQSFVDGQGKNDKGPFVTPGNEDGDGKSLGYWKSNTEDLRMRNGQSLGRESRSSGMRNVKHYNDKLRKEMEFVERSGVSRTVNRSLRLIEGTETEFEKKYRSKLNELCLKEESKDFYIEEFYELAKLSNDLINNLNEKKPPNAFVMTKIKNISEKLIGKINSENMINKNRYFFERHCKKCGKSNNKEEFEIFECGLTCLICFECRKANKSSYCEICNRSFTNYENNVLKTISKP